MTSHQSSSLGGRKKRRTDSFTNGLVTDETESVRSGIDATVNRMGTDAVARLRSLRHDYLNKQLLSSAIFWADKALILSQGVKAT